MQCIGIFNVFSKGNKRKMPMMMLKIWQIHTDTQTRNNEYKHWVNLDSVIRSPIHCYTMCWKTASTLVDLSQPSHTHCWQNSPSQAKPALPTHPLVLTSQPLFPQYVCQRYWLRTRLTCCISGCGSFCSTWCFSIPVARLHQYYVYFI